MLEEFDQAVKSCLAELLGERSADLPCEFRLAGIQRWHTDSPIVIQVEPAGEWPGPTDCEKVFGEIQEGLIRRLQGRLGYFGLSMGVPKQYLNYTRVLADEARQEEDNQRFRRIRLKENDHG